MYLIQRLPRPRPQYDMYTNNRYQEPNACLIHYQNRLPQIFLVPPKENCRRSRRAQRFSGHLKYDNTLYVSLSRVFPKSKARQFWARRNIKKAEFYWVLELLNRALASLYKIHKKLISTGNFRAPTRIESTHSNGGRAFNIQNQHTNIEKF